MVFWGKYFLSANLMEKFLSLTWTVKNILKTLYALKNIVFVERKKNVATTCREKKFRCAFKLKGYSLITF